MPSRATAAIPEGGVPSPNSKRVLLVAPTAGDALLSHSILREAGLRCHVCSDLRDMAAELDRGAGALILTDEVVTAGDREALLHALGRQEPWSDVPILLLCPAEAESVVAWAIDMLGNITVLDRPVRVTTLVSALRGAIRARNRQYELRDHVLALREAQASLRDMDRRKNEFLAILAHELRNPLAPIRNVAHYMKLRKGPGPELDRMVDMIERQTLQMTRLIDDLLEVSRLTSGVLKLRKERVELAEVVEAAVEGSRELIDARGHSLRVRLPRQAILMYADRDRLVQVLANLVSNAARYTPTGGRIEIFAERIDDALHLSVSDNGIGIPQEKLSEIFELFAQVDRSMERQGGLGIGLTLARQLIELHGGTIEARSPGVGHGSEFVVQLPIERGPDEIPQEDGLFARIPRRRVLVVDDNQDAAESLTLLLGIQGHDARLATSGKAALRLAAEIKPDVVFLDIGMPKMNGYDVARAMRAQSWGRDVHLVALTGWGQEEDLQRAEEAGFDAHVVKPAPPDLLARILAESAASTPCERKG
jgi:two-component system, sensor histidine kinase